jgi:D-alanine transaminase
MIVYLNGAYMPIEHARISPLDRGFIFGDAVYEGLRSFVDPRTGRPRIIGARRHADRMNAGLRAMGMTMDAGSLIAPSIELVQANTTPEAFVYWQVSSGTPGPGDAPRTRVPSRSFEPTVFMYCSAQPALSSLGGPMRKRVAVIEDVRWLLGKVKSTSLMGNVLMARCADAGGADEAVLVRGGRVVEGLATNVAIVTGEGEIATPSLDSAPMLAGVTRELLLQWAPEIVQRAVPADELATAREVLMLGTTTYVTACTHLDGRPINGGQVGPVAQRLHRTLIDGVLSGRDADAPPASP